MPGFTIGDPVVRNPGTWRSNDFGSWGRGIGVGVVVEPPFPLGPDEADVRWPGGRCFELAIQLLPAQAALATVGALVRISPLDDVQYWTDLESKWTFIEDRTLFRVEGWLEDGHIRYGLYGPVVDGPERYRWLCCSIITRMDGRWWYVSVYDYFHKAHPKGDLIRGRK